MVLCRADRAARHATHPIFVRADVFRTRLHGSFEVMHPSIPVDARPSPSVQASRAAYAAALAKKGFGPITTEILPAPEFYFAEDYHQQYLAKNPGGYCGLGGTGVSCPVGVGVAA